MKQINQSGDGFSLTRFCSLTRRYFVEHRKSLLTATLCTLGMLLLLGILFGRTFDKIDTTVDNYEIYSIGLLQGQVITELMCFYSCFVIFSWIAGSITFSAFGTKTGRINAMMVPAAKSEKFVMLTLIYTVVADCVFIIGVILADFVRSLLQGAPMAWSLHLLDFEPVTTAIEIITVMGLCILTGQAIYTLGSALWPRRSFIKTFGALFVLQIAAGIFVPMGDLITLVDEIGFWQLTVAMVIVIIGLYAAAWMRFKRLQVVQRLLN